LQNYIVKNMNKIFALFLVLNTLVINSYCYSKPTRGSSRNNFGPQLLLGLGGSTFLGDLGGKISLGTNDFTDYDLPSTRYVISGGLRIPLSNTFAVRGILAYTRLHGDDKYTANTERRGRNLNFTSPLTEGSLTLEISPGKGSEYLRKFYFYGGVGIAFFNPYTIYNGNKVRLQPLGTEGQNYLPNRQKYDLSATIFPFGLGYRIAAGRGILSFELAMRRSTTDYIDDVSTNFADPVLVSNNAPASDRNVAAAMADRSISSIPGFSSPGAIRGDPKNNDNYVFLMVYYHIPLNTKGNSGGFGGGGGKRRSGLFGGKRKCLEF